MLSILRSNERGHLDHGWLNTFHTFSFGEYRNPERMGFGPLRVINDDIVAPARGFAEHPHRNMEIISYVVSGTLRHADSTGAKEDITPGVVQRMSAGSGIRHSEVNPSPHEPVRLIQIWITPEREGVEPRHESRAFPIHEQPGRLHLLASPDGAEGSLEIHQDARVFGGVLRDGESVEPTLPPGRRGWVQVVRGRVRLNGETLDRGDAAAITDLEVVTILAASEAELLWFDLP
ncbi:MAG: pirin family protein [Phycisphaerales bacterium JB059]